MYIEVKDLKKSYGTGDSKVQVLRGVTTEVEQGKMCVIQGTSGSGKSTLLNCIGGLDTIDSGSDCCQWYADCRHGTGCFGRVSPC